MLFVQDPQDHADGFFGDAGEGGEFAEGSGRGGEDAEEIGGDGERQRGVALEVEGEGE